MARRAPSKASRTNATQSSGAQTKASARKSKPHKARKVAKKAKRAAAAPPPLSTLRRSLVAHPDTVPKKTASKKTNAGRGAGKAAGGMTYAASGVDIAAEDRSIDALAKTLAFKRTGYGAPMGRIGHFAGLIDVGDKALVLCTDGVGSKLEIANAMKKWDTVGIDCVAMNTNDALCVGAEPLAFVDYLAVEKPDEVLAEQLARGLDEGCRQSNCTLVGGETASLPGIVKGFDLAGTCLASVDKSRIVDGTRIRSGDIIIGLASTGIHSNGYSLARRVFESAGHAYTSKWPWSEDAKEKGQRIGDVLLVPTRIYVREILAVLNAGIDVHGLSHITGSGLRKLRRINQKVRYDITDPLPVPAVFKRIQQMGKVAASEMYGTFNMGMGFSVVVAPEDAARTLNVLRANVKYDVKVVGRVASGKGVHHPVGGVH